MRVVPRTKAKKFGAYSPTRSRSLASATTVDTAFSRHSSCKDPLDSTDDSEKGSSSGRTRDGDFESNEEWARLQWAPPRPPGLLNPSESFGHMPKEWARQQWAPPRPPGLLTPSESFGHVPKDGFSRNFLSTPAPQQCQDVSRHVCDGRRAQQLRTECGGASIARSSSIFSTMPCAKESNSWGTLQLPCTKASAPNMLPATSWEERLNNAIPSGCDQPLKVYMEHYDCEVPLLNPSLPAKKRVPDWFS
jgi:hypothetical protein